jgi:hypothetical protein
MMKRFIRNNVLFVFGVLMLSAGSVAAYQAGMFAASASGQGTLMAVDANGNTVRRNFSFNARTQADGTVQGHATLVNPAFSGTNNANQPYMLQIDVSCLKVVGNIAYMGGTIRRTNDPSILDAVYFAVQDNGDPGKGVDKISRVFFFDDDPTTTGDPQLCQNLPDPTGPSPDEIIEAGNIQVRQ